MTGRRSSRGCCFVGRNRNCFRCRLVRWCRLADDRLTGRGCHLLSGECLLSGNLLLSGHILCLWCRIPSGEGPINSCNVVHRQRTARCMSATERHLTGQGFAPFHIYGIRTDQPGILRKPHGTHWYGSNFDKLFHIEQNPLSENKIKLGQVFPI